MYGWAIRNSHTSTDEDHTATQSWRQAKQRALPVVTVRLTLKYSGNVTGFQKITSGYGDDSKSANYHPRSDQFLSHRSPVERFFSQ